MWIRRLALYRFVRKPDRSGPGVNANMSAPAPAHPGDQARDRGGCMVRAVCRGEGEVRRPDNGRRRGSGATDGGGYWSPRMSWAPTRSLYSAMASSA